MTASCLVAIALLALLLIAGRSSSAETPVAVFSDTGGFAPFWPDGSQDFLTPATRVHTPFLISLRRQGDHWLPMTGAIATPPFKPSSYMMVPMLGPNYVDDTQAFRLGDARVALRCMTDGHSLELMTAPSSQWFERVFAVPPLWCPGLVQLVAIVSSDRATIGIGPVFRASWADWLATGPLGVVAAMAFGFGCLSLFVVPFLLIRTWTMLTRLAVGMAYLSAAGFVLYFVGYSGAKRGIVTALAWLLLLLPVAGIAGRWKSRRTWMDAGAWWVWLYSFMPVIGLLLLSYFLLPWVNGSWFANVAFDPARWSSDDQLPMLMAKYLMISGPGHPPALGGWSIVDRGVAPSGILVGFLLLLDSLGLLGRNPISYVFLHLFQALIEGSVVACIVLVLRAERWSTSQLLMLGGALATSPFIFFNFFYVWPKLWGAALGLLGTLLIARGVRRASLGNLALGMGVFALGALEHSSIWLATPVPVLMVLRGAWLRRHSAAPPPVQWRFSLRACCGIAVLIGTSVILMLQSRLAPKSSYAASFLSTGQGQFGLNTPGIISAAESFTWHLGISGWISLKVQQLATLIWPGFQPYFAVQFQPLTWIDAARAAQFFSLLPALGAGTLLILLGGCRPGKAASGGSPRVLDLRWIGLFSSLILLGEVIAFNDPAVVHDLPYFLILGILIGCVSYVPACSARWVRISVGVQAGSLFTVWFLGAWWHWHLSVGGF